MEDVPADVATVTSTVPSVPVGTVAVICVSESLVTFIDSTPPKSTAVALSKSVPEIVTVSPPAAAPTDGLTPVTTGRARKYVNSSAGDVAETPPGVTTVTSTAGPTAPAGLTTSI